jgi:hypothetical protein
VSAAGGPVAPLTRVTLAGPARRVDLALPSDEPVGLLLPDILRLTAHRTGADPAVLGLALADGRVLAPGGTLRDGAVPDGAVLRVRGLADALPAPAVLDLSDVIADDLDARPGRWGDRARTAVAAVVVVLATVALVLLLPGPAAPVGAAVLGSTLLGYGAVAGALGGRPLGTVLVVAGAAAVLVRAPEVVTDPPALLAAVAGLCAVTVAAHGIACGRGRAGLIGAAAVLGQLGVWAALWSMGLATERIGAVVAVLTILLLGLLPRCVLVAAGLTRLDVDLGTGRAVPPTTAAQAVDTAHRGLVPAVLATAASGALAGLALAAGPGGWEVALAAVLAVVLLLRLRAYPLAVQVVGLLTAVLVVVGGLVARFAPVPSWGAAGAAVVVAVLGIAALGDRPTPHALARARRVADLVEGLAAMAALPLAVGVFGVYARLLEAFG